MARRLAIDTSFLIDIQRERLSGRTDGEAHRFLRGDPGAELLLPVTALGEFAEGFDDANHPVLRAVRELHTVLTIDEETSLLYARITRSLRGRGALIDSNDLWIAATCLRHGAPLVTANVMEFRRVPALEVVGYR